MDIINIDPNDYYTCSSRTRSTGFTSLIYLVNHTREHPEYLEQIKYILDHNPEELDKQNNRGWTALMIACTNSNHTSNLETVELLLKYNPDFYLINDSHMNVGVCIVRYINCTSSLETLKLLVKYNYNINAKSMCYPNRTILQDEIICAYIDYHDSNKYILSISDPNVQDYSGLTALMLLIINDYTCSSIKYFIDNAKNIDYSIKDKENKTALDYAIEREDLDIIYLIQENQDNSLDVKCALD